MYVYKAYERYVEGLQLLLRLDRAEREVADMQPRFTYNICIYIYIYVYT